ncbi:RHS repeat domain-containing protein [Pseudomonas migulae]|uniref:Insecticidal toxin complex protein TccC n=1 Tax=Pseudomonas migulae TaxID=78543 RepID=A0A1H5FW88_9PSED|nr:RHS repeat-associated core domain-containing protein [Pseudomonas migulae]SEE07726.1 insecticidal toxin complex protein TccC [Pseudomonas migulae]
MHRHTPKLVVFEPRRLAVRSVDYYRGEEEADAESRVNHTVHDPAGRAIAQWDPRLFLNASAPANLVTIHGLSGTELCTLSVDAGLHVSLFGEAGQPVHSWDGRGSQHWMHYDNQLRLTALFEQAADGEAVCAERLTYAANDQAFVDHNQCGRLICHEDPAGAVLFNDYGLTGAVLEQERRFAKEPSPGFITHSRFNPLNDLLSRTDAQGNEQRFSQTVGGQLRAVDLRLNNTLEWLPMVSAIACNAHGQVEREVAGNGVITTLEYTAEDGRLQRLVSRLGQNEPLQDLRYTYDPVGNVLSIEDAALPIRYFANQRIEPVSHYWYDTLYRLIEATGWEAGSVNHGPSSALTADPATPGNYRQTYRYDAGNNLLELTHVGPQNHGHRLVAEAHSNRCLPVRDGLEPGEDDFRNGFDANGNLLSLQPGQTLSWDLRNQLREVRPVKRDAGPDDCECYDYGADGMRVRKVRSLQTNAQTVVIETRYLPGVEIRTHSGTGEVLHVIDVATGRGSVRVLHWEVGKPNEITNNQQRYSLTDHLGSSTLELDQDASLITQERYYPFGGTAWSNGMAVQVSYKTVRYSGKEQDATGFYYYGFRYYVSWLQRWLNPDPKGYADGINLFAFVSDNPLRYKDLKGAFGIDLNALTTEQKNAAGLDGERVAVADTLYSFDIVSEPVFGVQEVRGKTYKDLKRVDSSNAITRKFLPQPANQIDGLWGSPLEPDEMTAVVNKNRQLDVESQVKAAITAGIGRCGEYAWVSFYLLASAKTELPVFRVKAANNVDHGFVVLGDPRVLPFDKIVVADAWPIFPRAHTLDVGIFEVGSIIASATADADPKYQMDDAKLIERSQVEFPIVGTPQRYESIAGRSVYTQLFSVQDDFQGIDYKREGHRRGHFNALPTRYVFERVALLRDYNSFRSARGGGGHI